MATIRFARRSTTRLTLILLAGASLAACATVQPKYAARPAVPSHGQGQADHRAYKTGEPYQVGGIWYVPKEQPDYDEEGIASWYGDAFNLKPTANGELFDMDAISGAHTTLPLPSMVEVTNLENGRKLRVRVNDRGPFVGNRIIDLSHAAARELGYDRQGLAHVRVRYLGPAPLAGPDAGVRYAQASPFASPAPAPIPVKASPGPSTAALTPAVADVPGDVVKTVAPPAKVAVATLTPPVTPPVAQPVAQSAAEPVTAPSSPAAWSASGAATSSADPIFRVQAGAFSDEQNARRALAMLSGAGNAVIEPMQRDGMTLYRVVLAGPADEAQAFALRDRIASIGFADARVLRPSSSF